MEKEDLLLKLKEEFLVLNKICNRQFEERFSTSKHEDKWQDDLFREYETQRIRIDLLIELLS